MTWNLFAIDYYYYYFMFFVKMTVSAILHQIFHVEFSLNTSMFCECSDELTLKGSYRIF